jgi:MFS family permease
MSHVQSSETTYPRPGVEPGPAEPSLGTLVSDLSSQIPELIRSEIRLAQAEVTEKGKRAGIGIGMFSVAGVLGLFGLGVVITTVILLLAWLGLPAWVAALIVAVVLFAVAGVAALLGKKKVAEAAPPVPERAVASVRQDVATVKAAAGRDENR